MSNLQSEGPLGTDGIRWLLPFLGLSMLTLAAIGYRYVPAAYFHVLTIVMLHPYPTPFIDAQQIPAVIDCWKHGVDVYVSAPCDPLHRVLAYSPLWVRATFLPKTWSNWMGLALDAAFFLSLALLPLSRRRSDIVIVILATFSSMTVFALERANMDVVMFLLIICAGWCWVRSFLFRLIGYGFIAFAGLLKFYPLVLFSLFLRERVAYFIVLCIAALALLAGFVWHFQGELQEMATNLPTLSAFSVTFGFRGLPFGLGFVLQWLLEHAGVRNAFVLTTLRSALFPLEVLSLLVLATVTIALRLARNADFRSAFAALAPSERAFLVIGAALISACFFATQNDNYRGIYFLFVLPGVCALSMAAGTQGIRSVFRATVISIIFVMWGMTIQLIVGALSRGSIDPIGGSATSYFYWIIRELTWWWIVSVLLAVLLCFVEQSSVWRAIIGSETEPGDTGESRTNPIFPTRA